MLIFGNQVTPMQVFGTSHVSMLHLLSLANSDCVSAGYSIALGGLVFFKTYGGK